MATTLPDLSRFEMQCLRLLWKLGQGTVRDLHDLLEGAPSYSTVRKIVERLEEKKAIARVRLDGKAWIYRPSVTPAAMMRKEIRRFLDALFDGSAAPLVAHLADMDALSVDDLRELERQVARVPRREGPPARRNDRTENRRRPRRSHP